MAGRKWWRWILGIVVVGGYLQKNRKSVVVLRHVSSLASLTFQQQQSAVPQGDNNNDSGNRSATEPQAEAATTTTTEAANASSSSFFESSPICRTAPFRILCTTAPVMVTWGSYKIRCRDLKRFLLQSEQYPSVQVDDVLLAQARGAYNVTMVVKHFLRPHKLRQAAANNVSLGKLFVDVVDQYGMEDRRVPKEYSMIVQNPYQRQVFPSHETFVVTHWYNTFPGDVGPVHFPLRPLVNKHDPLRLATIWSPDPSQAGCVNLSSSSTASVVPNESSSSSTTTSTVVVVQYDCIERDFDIGTWYSDYLDLPAPHAQAILANTTTLGPGYLYWTLFRTYDVLVVYAKSGPKKDYGNVQRAVSQMRSGVPVLLENDGKAHGLFIEKYNYSCGFTRENLPTVVARLRSLSEREQCQRQALAIVEDFSPQAIIKEFLQVFGYQCLDEEGHGTQTAET